MPVNGGAGSQFDVGGVRLSQPFKIHRLGHCGLDLVHIEDGLHFYRDLLGLRISDTIDFSQRASSPEQLAGCGDPTGYFMRYGSDHHAFVIFNRRVRAALGPQPPPKPDVSVNQITWQVGSMQEVSDAIDWFDQTGVAIRRSGRDMPGSNWHTYMDDPDGHTNELYYGIEQIGWSGYSKPPIMHDRGFNERPPLPQVPEYQEVEAAMSRGVDLLSGRRDSETREASFPVDGIWMPRPFKIVRLGPVRLFVSDVDVATSFYTEQLGFSLTEEASWNGHRMVFLRTNTEHHSLALYPKPLRAELGLSDQTTTLSVGFQVANYRQLRDAASFLKAEGAKSVELPPEVHPGVDHACYFLDPDGHAVELYFSMEQIGWDGSPRPSSLRRPASGDPATWPDAIEAAADTYMGETYLGPWA